MTFIISEIGVNWDGEFQIAEEMIQHSKNIGCNAVKFQAYTKDMIKDHPERERLAKAAISEKNIEEIDRLASSIGIEWFCTPMYPDAIDFLEPYVKRYKIREFDGRPLVKNQTSELLERVFATNKEIIISSQQDIKNSKFYNHPKIKSLYCVPKYPCQLEDLDFSRLNKFDGLSNHCPHIIAPVSAAILGAGIIEIHMTQDKNKNFVDNNVSFDYKELAEIVNMIRLSERIKR